MTASRATSSVTSVTPKVSVITVVKNAAATLEQTLLSVIETRSDLVEYIVIDGGSTDGSQDIIEKYSSDIDYWHSKPDQGISDAFNTGIAVAKGTFIALLNADDFYEPDTLARIVEMISTHPHVEVFHGSVRYIDKNGLNAFLAAPDIAQLPKYMSIYHPTMFVKKSAYQRLGTYSLAYHFAMDSEWVHRAVSKAAVFHQVDGVLANMRLQGASHDNLNKSLLEYRRSVSMHFKKPLMASFYYLRQLVLHTLLKQQDFRRLWLGRRAD